MPAPFPQTRSVNGDLQVIVSSDELFNHVDAGLRMWTGDGDRSVQVDVVFEAAFKEPPAITLGLTGIDAAHDQNLRFALQPTKVSATGFTIEFVTWSDTHIARASVAWQALGLAKPDIIKKADVATGQPSIKKPPPGSTPSAAKTE